MIIKPHNYCNYKCPIIKRAISRKLVAESSKPHFICYSNVLNYLKLNRVKI